MAVDKVSSKSGKRMVVPRTGVTAAASSETRWRFSTPALLASLLFHGALIAGVGIASERRVVNPTSRTYEVLIHAVDEITPQAPMETLQVVSTASSKAPEIAEPVEPSAAEEIRAVATAVLSPVIGVPEYDARPNSSEQIVILGLESEPETVAVASAEPAAAQPAGEVDGTGYWLGVRGRIFEHLVYPRLRRGQSADTNILLRVTIDGAGRLLDAVTDSEPSPYTLAAVRAAERAAPFDSPAYGVPLTMELPVEFRRN